MKKIMKKMLSVVMVAAVALGLGFAPAKAADGVTVHVEKPADWADSMNLYAWNVNGSEEPAGWPGQAMEQDADGFYTFTVATTSNCNIIFNDGTVQTVDMTDVAPGEYWYTAGTKGDDGKYTFTQSTTNPNGGSEEAATTDAAATEEPATGDATPVVLVSLIGLAAVAVFAASKKRSIA